MKEVKVIGAGLAGSEACSYLLKKGYTVHLYEARPHYEDHAHVSPLFGELVCSNSLKSKRLDNAAGLLKEEMRHMDSLLMEAASYAEVPSGDALSVDRDLFASFITDKLQSNPNLILHREEVVTLEDDMPTILATGPLTSPALLDEITRIVGKASLSFFDASAPIVSKESIDFSKAYFKSRYEQGDSSYINCPFTKEEYFLFVKELLTAKKALVHSFDTEYFEGCLPIEVIASRGEETLRHGPLKPFGLETENHPKPYAVAQLRQDTKLGDYYNLVGFQTNLTYPEQKRVFSLIPGLEHAEFIRYGLMHRNAYIHSPSSLGDDLSLKGKDNVYVAGQLAGVEGYVESAVLGIIAAKNLDRKLQGKSLLKVPENTITGALISYILHFKGGKFSPMNANWALLPNVGKKMRLEGAKSSLEAIDIYWRNEND